MSLNPVGSLWFGEGAEVPSEEAAGRYRPQRARSGWTGAAGGRLRGAQGRGGLRRATAARRHKRLNRERFFRWLEASGEESEPACVGPSQSRVPWADRRVLLSGSYIKSNLLTPRVFPLL